MSKRNPWDRKRTVVLLALAIGLSRAAASSKAGISDRTLRRWCEEEAFAEAVEIAMGEGRAVYEQLIRDHGERDWRAAQAAYELIYFGGGRPKAEANAMVVISTPPPQPKELTEAEKQETLLHAAEVVRVLIEAVGQQRTLQIIANREQERRRTGL